MQRNKSPTAPPPPNTAVPFPSFLPISTHPPYPTPPPPFQLLRDGTVKVTRQLVYSTLTFSSDFAELPKGCVRERVWGIVTLRCLGYCHVEVLGSCHGEVCLGYCHGEVFGVLSRNVTATPPESQTAPTANSKGKRPPFEQFTETLRVGRRRRPHLSGAGFRGQTAIVVNYYCSSKLGAN